MRLTADNHESIMRLFNDNKQNRIRDMNARIKGERAVTSMNPANNALSPSQIWAKGQAGAFMGLSWDDTASLENPNHIRGLSIMHGESFDNRIIDLPDHMREAMITFAREDFSRIFGGRRGSVASAERQTMLMHSFLREIPEQDRQAALWTLQQISMSESDRIRSAVREHMPNWTHGQRVPDDILRPILNGAGSYEVTG